MFLTILLEWQLYINSYLLYVICFTVIRYNVFTGETKINDTSVLFLLCFCARLFICALWSPTGKGLTSWLSFVVYSYEFVTFPLVSCVRCGT